MTHMPQIKRYTTHITHPARLLILAAALAAASLFALAACAPEPQAPAAASSDAQAPATATSLSQPAQDLAPAEQAVQTSWQPPLTDAQPDAPVAPAAQQPAQPNANVAPQPQSPQAPAELDANAIVAAFEQVIGGVHTQVLPSVVNIVVVNRVSADNLPPWLSRPSPFAQPPAPDAQPDQPDMPDEESAAPQDDFFFRNGQGSGFVWDSNGHIVTNHHVVEDAERIIIMFADGAETRAEIVGSDPASDLAVLKIDADATTDLAPLALGDSNAVRVGQLAIAIGNPFGQEFTTTTGIVSAVGRTIRSSRTPYSVPKIIQTDAPINPGNSGGPLLDRQANVIGIAAQIITEDGANSGVGFAIPVNTAKQIIPELIENGEFRYSWLGIRGTNLRPESAEMMDVDPATRGAHIIELAPDGPAEQAGFTGSDRTQTTDDGNFPVGGDIITAVNDSPITGMDDLIIYLLENTLPGDTVAMTVIRDGGEKTIIRVTLGERPE